MIKDSSNVKSILKYFDIKIVHFSPNSFQQMSPTSLAPSNGKLLPMSISRVIHTSDASPGECTIGLNSPEITEYYNNYESIKDINDTYKDLIPAIGDEIAIFITSVKDGDVVIEDSDYHILFKGYIIDMSIHKGKEGIQLVYNCNDMKGRLSEHIIKKNYNEVYLASTFPNYSEKNVQANLKPYLSEKWTVEKIIEDILETSKNSESGLITNTQHVTYFDFEDFDFNGLNELKDFIPNSLRFDNDTILEAIYKTISSAGSYRMIYDHYRDKIVFTRISINALYSGNERILSYASNGMIDYAEDGVINVISDNTVKKTSNLANIFRMYSSPIEWYSGHFYIKNGYTLYNFTRNDNSKYYLPDRNWDGYPYFKGLYTIDKDIMTNVSEDIYQIVGCPLYPAWNPQTGYEPYKYEIKKTKAVTFDKYGHVSTLEDYTIANEDKIDGKTYENQGFTVNDKMFTTSRSFTSAVSQNDFDRVSGFTYEAWIPYHASCRFCGGSGAVEPNIVKTEDVFGKTISDKGELLEISGTLTPFNYDFYASSGDRIIPDGTMIPRKHPSPWINTCPVCRGVGMEPWFKITNILNSLVDVGPNEVKLKEVTVSSESDRTWSEVANDTAYSYGPKIQIETNTNYPAIKRTTETYSQMPYHPLYNTKSLTGNKKDIFTGANNLKIDTLFHTQITINNACSIDTKRGNVIFKDRVFVACRKPIKNIKITPTNDYKEYYMEKDKNDSNSTLYREQGTIGGIELKSTSFWRPSKAWINCYFYRDKFYSSLSSTKDEITRKVELDGPEEYGRYYAFSKIEDNRYVLDVTSSYAEAGEFSGRPIIKGMSFDSARWQIHPWDMKKWVVPTSSGYDLVVPNSYSDDHWGIKGLFTKLKAANYYFSEGTVHIIEGIRKNEKDAIDAAAGNTTTTVNKVLRSDTYGKTPRWIHKDDRIKLMDRAVMELERRNDIQINGTISIRGTIFDYENGFGYVSFPDNTKACIVKIEYNFSNSYTIELEVGTESFRIGDKKEEDKDYERLIATKINELYKRSDNIQGGSISDKTNSYSGKVIDPANIIRND
ncbi:MAG: hypothetical protein M0P71_01365 [Melioribacteraceae bacterium]|nr:hypothetical protein [Melioribacteraceae bacterium]